MSELQGDFAPLGMHRIGNGFQVGEDFRAQPELIGQRSADFRHRRIGHGGQGDAASGQIAMVFEQGFGGKAFAIHILVGARFDKTVAKCNGPQCQGAERAGL